MAAPILWAPGIFGFFLHENLHAHEFLRFRWGISVLFGGGSADLIFMGAGIFLISVHDDPDKHFRSLQAYAHEFANSEMWYGNHSRPCAPSTCDHNRWQFCYRKVQSLL